MTNKKRRVSQDPTVKELEAIKRLLALLLLKLNTPQKEVAMALQMDPGDLSRMLPARQVKKFEFLGGKK